MMVDIIREVYKKRYPLKKNYFDFLTDEEMLEFSTMSTYQQNLKLGQITDLWHTESYDK